jgi:hypothetical protein
MPPDRRGRRKRGAIAKSEAGAGERRLTADDADRLATDLEFSEEARDVLRRWAQERWSNSLVWLLPDQDAECFAAEIEIPEGTRRLVCRWLRVQMLAYHLAEEDRHGPSVADLFEGLPQIAQRLAGIERVLRKHYCSLMELHEVDALPKSLEEEESDKGIAGARHRVEDDLRALGSLVARLEAMSRSGLFSRASGRRRHLTRKRPHDHILAESALTFWDTHLREQRVRRDRFCRLVLGLVGVGQGSIDTFMRDASKALRSRRG